MAHAHHLRRDGREPEPGIAKLVADVRDEKRTVRATVHKHRRQGLLRWLLGYEAQTEHYAVVGRLSTINEDERFDSPGIILDEQVAEEIGIDAGCHILLDQDYRESARTGDTEYVAHVVQIASHGPGEVIALCEWWKGHDQPLLVKLEWQRKARPELIEELTPDPGGNRG